MCASIATYVARLQMAQKTLMWVFKIASANLHCNLFTAPIWLIKKIKKIVDINVDLTGDSV